jgi:competence protein ComEC
LGSTVLKVPHHGSRDSSTLEFLQAVTPKTAVISVGADNDFGHPHREVIDRLKGLGIKILRTDYEGDIVENYW